MAIYQLQSKHLLLIAPIIECVYFNLFEQRLKKTNVVSTSLSLYPFEITPSIFELRKGEAFVLEVVFKPHDAKKYEQDIVIACDNCTTVEFKLIGEGELAQVEYVDVEASGMENLVSVDEFKDVWSSKIIRFSNLNPNVFERKKFAIRNNSYVDT